MTFRFDDCSINTDVEKLKAIIRVIEKQVFDVEIILAVSPIVFSGYQLGGVSERVHPTELTAQSFLEPYYRGMDCGIPHAILALANKPGHRHTAGHGLMHVDHRLLGRKSQEMSIIGSCSLAQAKIFVPPYNKWNVHTDDICRANGLELVKWEHGWKHVLYKPFEPSHQRYYLHPFDTTPEKITNWFNGGKA
jgi:hypothetical protein